jgi:parallel beta-helix repeat protein
MVADCTARFNTLDGIRCFSDCVIRGNTCALNGSGSDGAGIHATSSNNRIEGNNCTSADRGIDVDAAGNIIIRNTCADNTIDWVIAANNVVGPIIDRRTPASAAVSGFSAPSSLGSTDANANFSY